MGGYKPVRVTRSQNCRYSRYAGALLAVQAASAFSQSEQQPPAAAAASAPTGTLSPVVVVGRRASLVSAQAIKREAVGVVDAVVAHDINKLPDLNVTEALQRVTGVQIGRDRGEGSGVTIRGLTQVETLLNGREVFTAGNGRTLDFADIPAELVSSLEVHKTSSAGQVEGGIGGTVDLRTRRPFDFAGREIALSARTTYGDLVRDSGEQASVLFSDRWRTSAGEIGALLSVSHQRRAWREDQKSTGTPARRTDLVPGQEVFAPSGTTESSSAGRRDRDAANLVLQWRPSPEWELYAEGSYAQFKTRQDTYQINVFTSGATAQDITLAPGTSDVQSITWTNAPLSILSFARDTVDRMKQFAIGGSWRSDAWTLSADFSRTIAFNNLFFSGPSLAGTASSFRQDLSTEVPSTSLSGTDLLDPANLTYTSIAYRALPFHGDLNAARIDASYAVDGAVLESVSTGLRLARRGATNAPGLMFGDQAVNIPAANLPGTLGPLPYNNFLPGSTSLGNYLVGRIDTARDPVAFRETFGITTPLPTAGNPLGVWTIDEATDAAYLLAHLKAPGQPVDGNAGVRVVRTKESVDGWQTVQGSGSITPIDVHSRYTDVLPSVNLRWRPSDGLVLRAAASKTVTRPDFNQLSPSLVLVRNTVDTSGNSNTGTAGNPALRPIRANNVDVAVERYFSESTSVYATVFWKKVDGFLSTVIQREIHDGVPYNVSRPQNMNQGTIKGAEIGYQQFFDFLPGWLSGFGVQANYTYVDGRAYNPARGADVALQNLSRNSANLVGLYEKGPWSTRVAYNWRDRFVSSTTTVVGTTTPSDIYIKAYGWLDASLSYRVNDRLWFALEGSNLLRTRRSSYYDVPTRPQSSWLNDRQYAATVTVRF